MMSCKNNRPTNLTISMVIMLGNLSKGSVRIRIKKDASHLLAKFGTKMYMRVTKFGVGYWIWDFCQIFLSAKHDEAILMLSSVLTWLCRSQSSLLFFFPWQKYLCLHGHIKGASIYYHFYAHRFGSSFCTFHNRNVDLCRLLNYRIWVGRHHRSCSYFLSYSTELSFYKECIHPLVL